MNQICIASNNNHKKEELRFLLKSVNFEINENITSPNVVEDGLTLEDNAIKKAKAMYQKSKILSVADDTGLEVYYLNMKPGVFSARFAGENVSYDDNNKKLLTELLGVPVRRRKACFRSIIAIYGNGIENIFEGRIEGIILESPRGNLGFGYDPLFQPIGFSKSFAELSLIEKNKISHRAIAISKLIDFLKVL